jgi:RimJ/RimL family protein N-acetyltransferase
MTGMLVRPMRAEDVDAALDVVASVALEERWLGTPPGFDRAERRAQWLGWIEDPFVVQLVVADAGTGRIVGNGGVHRARYGVADLGMSLLAEARGRGQGGALLDGLVEAARGMRAHKVALQVWPHNEPAIRLYLSRGFAVEGRIRRHYRRANGQHWDAIQMGLLLDEALRDEEPTGPDGAPLPDATVLPATLDLRQRPAPAAGGVASRPC